MGHHMAVFLDLLKQALGLHGGDHLGPRGETVEPAKSFRHIVVEAGLGVEDVDHLQIVAAADLEIVEVMGRRHLDRARALLRVGVAIADNWQTAADQGQDGVAPDQVEIARVLRMDRHATVAEHGLRAGGGDGDEGIGSALQRVFEIPQLAVDLALFDLQVGNRGLQFGVPVDQPLVAIDQPLVVKIDEHLAHGVGQALVHGEAFAPPIGRGAKGAQLMGDGAAGFRLPGPHLVEKGGAPEIAAIDPLVGQLAFDHHLGGDAGVVGTGLP